MNIALIGYGKMGKAIEQIALKAGHTISCIVHSSDDLSSLTQENIDVAIEFTQPESAFDNLSFCINNGIPVISGTTGWIDQLPEIEKQCREKDGTFLYASNFSIGVNLFFKLNKFLAKLMSPQTQYKPSMIEVHHTHKKDAPSGTAITLAEGIISEHEKYNAWKNEATSEAGEIPIASERIGEIPGTHKITYKSEVDQISIEHEAYSRDGFVQGAVFVAEWLPSQKGIVKIDDFLKL